MSWFGVVCGLLIMMWVWVTSEGNVDTDNENCDSES